MAKRDLTNLPKGKAQQSGRAPDKDNKYGKMIHDAIIAWDAERSGRYTFETWQGPRDTAIPDSLYRASMAGECMRAMGYYMSDAPVTNPPDGADLWRMQLGTLVHDFTQSVVKGFGPDGECEVITDLNKIGIPGSGHADVVIRVDDELVELKSDNGYGFKQHAVWGNPPQGPRDNHVRQGAILAEANGLSKVVIVYMSLELVGPGEAKKSGIKNPWDRFTAQWTYEREEWEPLVRMEVARFNAVKGFLETEGPFGGIKSVPRHMPDMPPGARIVDVRPSGGRKPIWNIVDDDGRVRDTGTHWKCTGYCRWADTCLAHQKEENSDQLPLDAS